jgi:hypothetical protein
MWTLVRLQRRLHHPDSMQLPAHEVGIEVIRLGDFRCRLVIRESVRAVRDVHLLLADELPLVAIERAVEHRHVVVGSGARSTGVRRVVREIGSELHAALTRQVLPGAARLLQRVDGVDPQQRLAVAACGADIADLDQPVRIGGIDRARLLRIEDRPGPVELARGRPASARRRRRTFQFS